MSEKNQFKKRKSSFWLMVSEVSIHGQLVCGKAEHQDRHLLKQRCSPIGSWETKKTTGRNQGPFKSTPPMT
jgi:hypothetical protein